ncbi:MAG: two-component regulator propeller domain-containing protein [Segetibacter sp.]
MKVPLLLIFSPVLLLLAIMCPAQDEKPTFHHVPLPRGGRGGLAGVQDAHGFLWVAQTGVHRYDGYNFTSYFNDPLDSNSLAENRVEALWADSKGFIWVGTRRSGLDRLDPVTGVFRHYRYNAQDHNSLSDDTIRTMIEDHEGKIWIGTDVGLNRLDPATGLFQRFLHDPDNPSSLSCNKVTAIYEDRQGTLWIGTGSIFLGEGGENDEGGLNRFNKITGKFIRYIHKPADPHTLISNKVEAIFEDSRGRFWVGTAGDGLHTMNRAAGTFERHRYDPTRPEALSRPAQKKVVSWANDHISFIREDVTGAVWIGTYGNGLNRYDPQTKKVAHFPGFKDPVSGVRNDIVRWVYSSRDGVLWIGYLDGGIYRVDPLQKSLPYFNTGTNVTDIYEDDSGMLWYGTAEGLIRKDRSKGTEQRYTHKTRDPFSLSDNEVNRIYEDRQGMLWVGTPNGLNRFDRKKENFSRYKVNAFTIYEDRSGSFWLGTRDGLVLMNRQNGFLKPYRYNLEDTTSFHNNTVNCMYEDKSGDLWVGGYLGGVNRFIPESGRFERFLKRAGVISLCQDSEGILWVGTSTGLYRSNAALNQFARFTVSNIEILENIKIDGILEDNQKALWINTPEGVYRINPQRSEIVRCSKHERESIYTSIGSYKGRNGELFFSGPGGYYGFFPEHLNWNKTPPQIVLSAFRLANKLVIPGKEGPLQQPLWQTKEIRLRHDQNVFSFDFAGIHYSNPELNQHLFRLEGLDADWHKAGEEKTAYYYNVPPGHYTFRVKAANSDGVWAEKSIAVIVTPPWWGTGWAYSLYVLLFMAGVYVVHSFQRQRLIRKEQERRRQVELVHAKEIEKAYTKLKATQTQLIQQEKMASLGELTAGIAHEIQNPLNFVNNFSEVNKEMIAELKEEINKGNYDEVKLIANDLEENEEKINHHGKRADAIVKGMLQHSRTSTGKKEHTDINALADEYLRLSYHGLRAKDKDFNADFKTNFDESIGKIDVVQQDIGRVFLNLYNNAFYAVNEKKKQLNGTFEPTVEVTTKRVSDRIEVSVKDNGTGIPQKVLDKIYQPFFTTKPTGQGTGLGLSLSYDIIKAHGGELKVETKEGEGAEFIIILPI